jgi:RNA polymerase sigma-70 factor (ECF subfamily)
MLRSERDALFGEFQPLVRRLVKQYGDRDDLREDLEGELYCRFCDLYQAFDAARGIPLRAYLVRTLTAAAYTYARSHWRRRARQVSLDAEPHESGILRTADPTEEWDREIFHRDTAARLPVLIARLPERQRQVVVARYYESRSFEEIAEEMRIRPATARSLLRHGLLNLRRRLS